MGCANPGTLSGGKRDAAPPRLMAASPKDSLLNVRVTKLQLQFDEYVSVGEVTKEVEVSPILTVPPAVTSVNKHVTVKITDSLLQPNTTYRISFGKAIRDVHEGNAFTNYTYTFSTGSYFDSLEVRGKIKNAKTGLPDSSGVVVVLYDAKENDSAIVKKKPRYKTLANAQGQFTFKGLPQHAFRIYAIKDENNNLTYDGGNELIAFNDSLVVPADSFGIDISLSLFAEIPDTTALPADTATAEKKSFMRGRGEKRKMTGIDTTFSYTVGIDTLNKNRRTFDITDSIKITFNKEPLLETGLVKITFDSAGLARQIPIRISKDTADKKVIYLNARMKENTVYALTLSEGFAYDTLGHKNVTARYVFKTFNDEDYGKIKLNIPEKYISDNNTTTDYLLVLMMDNKEVAQYRITEKIVALNKLRPSTYTFRIIVDRNKNGKWDTGDLFGKKQPEDVIPCSASVTLKAGWDNTIDFEPTGKSTKDKNRK
jgi:hypothetical protein